MCLSTTLEPRQRRGHRQSCGQEIRSAVKFQIIDNVDQQKRSSRLIRRLVQSVNAIHVPQLGIADT